MPYSTIFVPVAFTAGTQSGNELKMSLTLCRVESQVIQIMLYPSVLRDGLRYERAVVKSSKRSQSYP